VSDDGLTAHGTMSNVQRRWTDLQGQYLAFIHMYTKVNGVAPAEADMQRYFRVTPPSVHRMVVALAEAHLIERIPGKARSIRVALPIEEIPILE